MFFEGDKPCLSLKDVENGVNQCNAIKYAAYRTAAKLRVIQKALYMDKVQLRLISCVLERHHLQQTENSVRLEQKEIESVLSDIYFVIKKENNNQLDTNYISHLMFSFLLAVFDKKALNTIQVFSIKVGLTLLCNAKPREKYHYLFEQLADHNNCLSKKKFEIILKKIIKLTEYLREGHSFGSNLIAGTVESLFQYNAGGLRLSEDVFMEWLMQDPQLLVWLSTFYRMHISESVSHNAKCGICKIYPLVGLRYRCLRCLSFDMCQACFFTRKLNKKHKLKHPVQEYCYPMTSQQSTKAFLLTLRNRLYKKDSKLQYLPALKLDPPDTGSLGQKTRFLDDIESTSRTVLNGSRISLNRFPYRELRNIILHLEKESEKIILQMENFYGGAEKSEVDEWKIHLKNCLMKHKAQVTTQMDRLKLLRNYLSPNTKAFVASTPVVDEILLKSQKKDLNVELATLSPISVRTYKKKEETPCEKMMWDNYDLCALDSKPSWEELESRKLKSNSSGILQMQGTVDTAKEATLQDKESEFELSTWLAGKAVHELNSTSRKGVTWLYEKESDVGDSVKEENDVTIEEFQADLKKILNKLQELSVLTSKEENDEIEPDKRSAELDVVGEVDTLLMDLIDGIEKLMGS